MTKRGRFSTSIEKLLQDTRIGSETSEHSGLNQFEVLFVCTGNICRSAFAEHYLASLVQSRFDWLTTASSGLGAENGREVDPTVAKIIETKTGQKPEHESRETTDDIVDKASLILVMTKDHRKKLLHQFPQALKKTFTLTEFASLVRQVKQTQDVKISVSTPQEAAELVNFLADQALPLYDYHDVPDPISQPVEVHQRVANTIANELDYIYKNLFDSESSGAR